MPYDAGTLKERVLLARAGASLFRTMLARLRSRSGGRDGPLSRVLADRAAEEEEVEARLRQLEFALPQGVGSAFGPEQAHRLLQVSFPTAFRRFGEAWLGREAVFRVVSAGNSEHARAGCPEAPLERRLRRCWKEVLTMTTPFDVVVRGTEPPAGTREEIREMAARLEHFHGRILRGRVTLESRSRRPGWAVRITLDVPGGTVVVSRQKGESLSEAVRESFAAATRRLEDYLRRRRGFVKLHA
jgi:hypothetical protein